MKFTGLLISNSALALASLLVISGFSMAAEQPKLLSPGVKQVVPAPPRNPVMSGFLYGEGHGQGLNAIRDARRNAKAMLANQKAMLRRAYPGKNITFGREQEHLWTQNGYAYMRIEQSYTIR
jgi:hypothetical protein